MTETEGKIARGLEIGRQTGAWLRGAFYRLAGAGRSVQQQEVRTEDNLTIYQVDTIEEALGILAELNLMGAVYMIDIDKTINEPPHVPVELYARRKVYNFLAGVTLQRNKLIPRREDPPPYMMALGIDVRKAASVVGELRRLDPSADIFFATARTDYHKDQLLRGGIFRAMAKAAGQLPGFDWVDRLKAGLEQFSSNIPLLSIAPRDYREFETFITTRHEYPQIVIVRNFAKNFFERGILQPIWGARRATQIGINQGPLALAKMTRFRSNDQDGQRALVIFDDKHVPGISEVASGGKVILFRIRGYDPYARLPIRLQ